MRQLAEVALFWTLLVMTVVLKVPAAPTEEHPRLYMNIAKVPILAGGDQIAQGNKDLTGTDGNHSPMCVADEDTSATLSWTTDFGRGPSVRLMRPDKVSVLISRVPDTWSFLCHDLPLENDDVLTWKTGVFLSLQQGRVATVGPTRHEPPHVVVMGKLHLLNPQPIQYPVVHMQPEEGVIAFDVVHSS